MAAGIANCLLWLPPDSQGLAVSCPRPLTLLAQARASPEAPPRQQLASDASAAVFPGSKRHSLRLHSSLSGSPAHANTNTVAYAAEPSTLGVPHAKLRPAHDPVLKYEAATSCFMISSCNC
jgi:hypothetical protein